MSEWSTRRARLRARVWQRDGGVCWICGTPVTLAEMTLDHEIPKVLGGKGGANLRASHKQCNNKRGSPGHQPNIPKLGGSTKARKRQRRGCKLCNSNPCLGGCTGSGSLFHYPFKDKLAAQKQDEDSLAQQRATAQRKS